MIEAQWSEPEDPLFTVDCGKYKNKEKEAGNGPLKIASNDPSMLAFISDYPCSNPAEAYSFSEKILFKQNKIKHENDLVLIILP